jgi:cytochrome b involved in lipid metabolism
MYPTFAIKYNINGWSRMHHSINLQFAFQLFHAKYLEMVEIDGAEVAKHNNKKSCWIVLESNVYDVTSFLSKHPGGAAIILKQAGSVRITKSLSKQHF